MMRKAGLPSIGGARIILSTDNTANGTTHSKENGRRDNISSAAYHSPTIIINNNVGNVRGAKTW